MPTEYAEFWYDYKIDGSFSMWLQAKDNDGWELVTTLRDYSNLVNSHILSCIFRRRT